MYPPVGKIFAYTFCKKYNTLGLLTQVSKVPVCSARLKDLKHSKKGLPFISYCLSEHESRYVIISYLSFFLDGFHLLSYKCRIHMSVRRSFFIYPTNCSLSLHLEHAQAFQQSEHHQAMTTAPNACLFVRLQQLSVDQHS